MRKLSKLILVWLVFSLIMTSAAGQPSEAKRRKKTAPEPTPITQPTEPAPAPAPEPAPAPPPPKAILGFYTVYYQGDLNSYNSLNNYGSYLNRISTMTFTVTPSGGVSGLAPSDGVRLAASKGIISFAAITNNFDSNLAHSVLSSSTARGTLITNLVNLVKSNGYQGVNVDFENMLAADRPYFSQFVRDLGAVLRGNGYQLIVSVPAKTSDSPNSAWVGTFDYAALGAAADQIQVMTYDQHGSWGSPGPVAGYPWVESVVKYAASVIAPGKILLGLAAYGYDWNTSTNSGHKAVAWKNIPNLISATGAKPQWDATQGSPYFTYASNGQNHIVWYENEASIQAKTRLVNQYGLGGVGMWRMGLENLGFWTAVQNGLAQ